MFKIVVLGLDFRSGNKGCCALAYSFMNVLNRIAIRNNTFYEIVIVSPLSVSKTISSIKNHTKVASNYIPLCSFSNLSFSFLGYKYLKGKLLFDSRAFKCDIVFDFTAGDSFTDIYGKERFYERTKIKQMFINKKIPFVLGSQTIGPFKDEKVKSVASKVIRESTEVFVRDKMSFDYTKKISGRTPILTTDVAFFLPFETGYYSLDDIKIKVGINVSGLLWNKAEEFDLSVDYKDYCYKIIEYLLEKDIYSIYLINHAYSNNLSLLDNDLIASSELKKKYDLLNVSPDFSTPMEAKSYIASMDCFLGARMHATIGAFSAGVPVIPFSYSRKFEGLFHSLDYNYVISGKELNTDEAITKTINYIEYYNDIKNDMKKGLETVDKLNRILVDSTEEIIHRYDNV